MKRFVHFLFFFFFVAAMPAQAQKRIALTFDDIPRDQGAFLTQDERTVKLIAALERAGVKQAAFFITAGFANNPDRVGAEDRITAYAAAGHVLANHSYTHPHLSQVSAEEYLANLDKTEAWLKGRAGRRPWFRHPYLDEGMNDHAKRDAVRAGLKARGLRNGYVTADGADWHIEMLTQEAAIAGKPMDMTALRDFYVDTHVETVRVNHALARRLFDRDPIQVLLLHETDIAALFIDDLVEALRKDGWEIVTADKAFDDALKREMPSPPVANGTILSQVAIARGLDVPTWPGVASGDVQRRRFTEQVLKERVPPPTP
jgi:peptidoglycan/xylan/chitin deacetylase (PgdA/CDA1 family)